MGAKSYMEPYGFSADLNSYLRKVLADNSKDDLSGRWLEEVTQQARRYDYWSKLVKDTRAMTTNDIQVLAHAFGISPFDWVDNTKRHAQGLRTMPLRPNVRGYEDDVSILTREEEQAIRQADENIAAYRGENEAEQPHAD